MNELIKEWTALLWQKEASDIQARNQRGGGGGGSGVGSERPPPPPPRGRPKVRSVKMGFFFKYVLFAYKQIIVKITEVKL